MQNVNHKDHLKEEIILNKYFNKIKNSDEIWISWGEIKIIKLKSKKILEMRNIIRKFMYGGTEWS